MQVLLVEDEDPKRQRISAFVGESLPHANIQFAKSVRSAVAMLRQSPIDLMLLDMSLPTFDVTADESGGRPQGFGGMEVLRYMDRFKITTPTIVITAYEAFFSDDKKGVTLDSLDMDLKNQHPHTYVGLVYYNLIYGGWDKKLMNIIQEVSERGHHASFNS